VIPISTPPIREGAVVLGGDDDAIVIAVGTRADLRRERPGLSELRAEGALCPGLVNAHAHLELSTLAGRVPGGDGVVAWTRRLDGELVAQAAQANAPDAITAAATRAASEAKACGTAAMGDVGNGTAGWLALARAGLRGLFFHEMVGSRETRTGDALGAAAADRAAVPEVDRPTGVDAVVAPHAPYSVGPDLMRRIFATAATSGHPTTIHLAEDLDEILLLRDGSGAWPAVLRSLGVAPEERVPGLSPTEYLESLDAFAGPHPPLLVHMVHADADDRRRARDAGATVVLCPRSNLHIGGRLPDVPALIGDGVRLAIGTDSLASAPSVSPWGEIATLAARFPEVQPAVWLAAATQGGASALGLDRLGSLSVGKRPGLIDVALADAGDRDDPERALVLDSSPSVRWVASA
jgi:cytosine/adenosine deaminase-related metal-dependent hydrolase